MFKMLLGSFIARFSHGLLIISAPESVDDHRDWNAVEQVVHAGPDSIYIGVRDTVSGLVEVVCVEGGDVDTDLVEVFSGHLTLPSARLKFYDPDETISMCVPVEVESVTVRLFLDDSEEASRVYVHILEG